MSDASDPLGRDLIEILDARRRAGECPVNLPASVLERLVTNMLDTGEAERVRNHLAECVICLDAYAEVVSLLEGCRVSLETAPGAAEHPVRYEVEGSLLESCSCYAPCPCWIGGDPDGGKCDAFIAYRIERGSITGVDVSDVTLALVLQLPGNILQGNWKVAFFVSDNATPAQKQVVLDAWSGRLGGPLADLARLVGEVRGVHDAPVEFRLDRGKGTLRIGRSVQAEVVPFADASGNPTALTNTIFTTIPGSPAYVAKATSHRVTLPEHGMEWSFENRSAIQGSFRFKA